METDDAAKFAELKAIEAELMSLAYRAKRLRDSEDIEKFAQAAMGGNDLLRAIKAAKNAAMQYRLLFDPRNRD